MSGEMSKRFISTCEVVQNKLICRMYKRLMNSDNELLSEMFKSDIIHTSYHFKTCYNVKLHSVGINCELLILNSA